MIDYQLLYETLFYEVTTATNLLHNSLPADALQHLIHTQQTCEALYCEMTPNA